MRRRDIGSISSLASWAPPKRRGSSSSPGSRLSTAAARAQATPRSDSTRGGLEARCSFDCEARAIPLERGKPRPAFMERSGSILDQFRTAEQRVAERLRELEPLVEEYRELEQVARRLGLDRGERAPASDNQRPASPARSQGRRRRSKTNARSARSTREAGGKSGAAVGAAAGTPAGGGHRPQGAGGKGRPGSKGGSRQQDVLRLVNQHPGSLSARSPASSGSTPPAFTAPCTSSSNRARSRNGAPPSSRPAGDTSPAPADAPSPI
jgi:hypothetical protein